MYKYIFFLALLLISCKEEPIVTPEPPVDYTPFLTSIPASEQRTGDPEIGKEYLISGDYIDAGIPREIYDSSLGLIQFRNNELDRTGINEDLNYGFNGYINDDGVSLVVTNCLQCHAGYVDNQFILGLGNTFADYTTNQAAALPYLDNLVISEYGIDSPEYDAFYPFFRALEATGAFLRTKTVGSNPANKLALILAANRNQDDLTWRNELNFEIPSETYPADVPPWWLLKKKNAMYSTGLGRGDFAKHMMTASILTLEDNTTAEEVDAKFADVLAFINTIEAPKYPGTIDQTLADQGGAVFIENCVVCHGFYSAYPTYPNLFVDQSLIDTDPALADASELYTEFVDWFNNSWFTTGDYPAEYNVVDGYVAPPLDGIWASAPYLHNGSVPTLAHFLNSSTRPAIWKKKQELDNYDHINMGLKFTEETSKLDKYYFDTNLPGYSNKGHYFADKLDAEERLALLEYLKTL